MQLYHDANALKPSRLGPSTPLGLFKTLDPRASAKAFWIVEDDGAKSAIILEADNPGWLFDAWLLNDSNGAWTGVCLGAVEVQVDIGSGEFVEAPRFGRGAITITGGAVYVSAVRSNQPGSRVAFKVAEGSTPDGECAALFGRWRLIQRDRDGKPVVLFTMD